MIFFKVLTEKSKNDVIGLLTEAINDIDIDYAGEILDSLLMDNECEYAISNAFDCMLIRIFDGAYSFAYPVALTDKANPTHAAWEIREYSVKEEIPLVYVDVPREELGALIVLYRHANIDASDESGDSFRVSIMSEAALLDDLPTMQIDDLTLDALTCADDQVYSCLCRDEMVNKYWGYDYREDEDDPDDSYFREVAEGEFSRGISMTFAVRNNGEFAGEALLYAFDHLGGCECAVRLLPKFTRKNIATKAILALKAIAGNMGLLEIYATIDSENYASHRLCEKCFTSVEKIGLRSRYSASL